MTANGHRLRMPPLGKSLSARVLLLTIAFVMLGEVLIYAPSAGRFRLEYLRDRLATAHVAVLALLATPNFMVSDSLQAELMQHAGAYVVALKRPDGVKLMMRAKSGVPQVDAAFDLTHPRFFPLIADARGPHRLFGARARALHRHLADHRGPGLSQPAMAHDPAHAAADGGHGRLPRRSRGP